MTDQLAVVETTKQEHPLVVLRERLEARKSELRAALVEITPEQFIRALITSATINPDLQACTWPSLWLACMQACRAGLLPDGVDGAIVPYKSRATWIPMYQGLLRRFRRSGKFKWVTANVVREGEEFEHWVDEHGEHFRHVQADSFERPITKIYALATTLDGGFFCTVMSIAEANKIRNMSRAQRDDSPWKMWPEEMYKKTALRRLSKMLPDSRDIVPDEDTADELIEAKAPTTVQIERRKPGAAAALDHFAPASPPADDGLPSDNLASGAAEQGPEEPSAASDDVDRAPALDLDEAHQRSIEAYKRGQDAKSKGHQRKAIPPEYRERDRTREALCWQAGFDGGAMPEFSSDGKELVP